jgi:pimeloyl-ACP methyl ester carboxylesterase
MAPLARDLADRFVVAEPMQRASGGEPLGVDRHVRDLDAFLDAGAAGGPLAVVGSSWGAMLALAYAAAHPEPRRPLVLIGCGTFEEASRTRMRHILEERLSGEVAEALARSEENEPDPDRRLAARARLVEEAYIVDPVTVGEPGDELAVDARGHQETWEDMVRLQQEGVYPAAFSRIRAPVLMLHGEQDPHPGAMIRDSLLPHLPQLEYVAFARCGHYPWRERSVRASFLGVLRAWLADRLQD